MHAGQYSLTSLFWATAFVALACFAARHFALPGEPLARLLVGATIPIFVCGAIGTLRGRLPLWIGYGVAFNIFGMGMFVLLALLIHKCVIW
jgi:hypothetical protein